MNPSRRMLLAVGLALAAASPADADDLPFVTRHAGTFHGQTLAYTATVGETVLRDSSGTPTVRFVCTAYTRDGAPAETRPVLFAFNGGPSASSATLHLLALGPKRARLEQDPTAPARPPETIDNAECLLDVTDLVFVDPPETGFSRVLPGGSRAECYSTDGDARAVTGFVTEWLRANHRESSPRYVLGESYGTLRAALMAARFAATRPLDGVVLFGQAVNIIETSQRAKNALAYATNLPALAAVAAYHHRAAPGGRTLDTFIDEAYAWGMTDYLQALVRGRDLPERERTRVAARLERFTGIPATYYLAHDLAISKVAFARELLRAEGRILAMSDARYTGPAPAAGGRAADPFAKVLQAVRPALETHLVQDLGVTRPMADYRDAAPDAESAWTWNPTGGYAGPFLDYDYAAGISKAFAANPRFRLLIGTGIYDLSTTVGPARYLVARSDFPADRVFLRQYEGGHMAYSNEPALRAFSADLRAFLTGAPLTPGGRGDH